MTTETKIEGSPATSFQKARKPCSPPSSLSSTASFISFPDCKTLCSVHLVSTKSLHPPTRSLCSLWRLLQPSASWRPCPALQAQHRHSQGWSNPCLPPQHLTPRTTRTSSHLLPSYPFQTRHASCCTSATNRRETTSCTTSHACSLHCLQRISKIHLCL